MSAQNKDTYNSLFYKEGYGNENNTDTQNDNSILDDRFLIVVLIFGALVWAFIYFVHIPYQSKPSKQKR